VSTTVQADVARLPRGPHQLSRAEVENHQRERMLAAMVASAGTKGYAATTIADITRRARVSRDTFYEQFANKEACFLAAYDGLARELLDVMVTVGTSQPNYVEGLRGGVRAYLEFLSARPEVARVVTVEVLAAGGRALEHHEHTVRRCARLFHAVAEQARVERPDLPTVPDVVSRAIPVAFIELVTLYVREDRVSSLHELESDILYLLLMGMAGHDVAAAALVGRPD
jgi:AcrR family transcriptional regulator